MVKLNSDKIKLYILKMAANPKLKDAVISCHYSNDVMQCSSQLSKAASHLSQDQGAKVKRMTMQCFPMENTWWRTRKKRRKSR